MVYVWNLGICITYFLIEKEENLKVTTDRCVDVAEFSDSLPISEYRLQIHLVKE